MKQAQQRAHYRRFAVLLAYHYSNSKLNRRIVLGGLN